MHPGCRIDQVYLCRDPIDFRKSIGGLSLLVEQELGLDPFGSALYVFVNRQRNKIKVLYWHRNGFCLWLKRLTDAASLTALLHAVIASHNDVKTQALNHMQHMLEQFILARHRMFGASSEQSAKPGSPV